MVSWCHLLALNVPARPLLGQTPLSGGWGREEGKKQGLLRGGGRGEVVWLCVCVCVILPLTGACWWTDSGVCSVLSVCCEVGERCATG